MAYIYDSWYVPDYEIVPSDAVYADGVYEGHGTGIGYGNGDDIPVTVTVEGGKVVAVALGNHNETPNLGGAAMQFLCGKVIEANGTDGVDTVGSATISSFGFLNAVNEALAQAL